MGDKRRYHTVARAIVEMIDSGECPPGTKLPGALALSKRFSVSRMVVREATIYLEATGRLELQAGSSVYIRDTAANWDIGPVRVSPFEIAQFRLRFEPECAALAASAISGTQLATLKQLIDQIARAPRDVNDREGADREFHLEIARATDNPANTYVLQSLWRLRGQADGGQEIYDTLHLEDHLDRVSEYTDILEALMTRDGLAARQAMQRHLERFLEALINVWERQAIKKARQRSYADREQFLKLTL